MKAQFIVVLASRLAASALQALMFILFGRISGVEILGITSAVIGVAQFVSIVADIGMSTYLSKSRASGREAAVHSAIRLNAITAISYAVAGCVLVLALFRGAELVVCLALIVVWMALEKSTETLLSIPIADGRKWTVACNVLIRRGASLGAFLAALAFTSSPIAFGLGLLIGGLLGQIQARVVANAAMRPIVDHQKLSTTFKAGLPFLVSNVTAQARILDVSIVGLVAGPTSAGLYSAASRIINPFMLVPSTMTALVMPYATRGDSRRAVRTGLTLTAMLLAFGVLLIPVMLYSEDVLVILFGSSFAAGAPMLVWLLIALPFVALSSPLGTILQSQNLQRSVAINGVVFSVVTIVALVIGAILLGAVGAAMGIAVSYLVKCVSLWGILLSLREGPKFSEQKHKRATSNAA